MHRLLAAALTCVVAAGLAVGAGIGLVAVLNATPEQPNVPLVHFHSSPDEVPGLDGTSPSPSASPGGSEKPSPDASRSSADEAEPGGSDAASPGASSGNSPGSEQSGEPSASAAPGD
ncbi:hypothetical protein [Streptomyces iconiensis]|uniref:Uncharacterized protein n=1 Tax=Streptomyces iconiensis TaxID=1384038 RepID=A0ABT6ZNJ4_9ACTN|nr:hypothetical protein [Streptomyces iconiensis]MDJ1130605.1 hypothetical protein [Streptomyces iconiensis]